MPTGSVLAAAALVAIMYVYGLKPVVSVFHPVVSTSHRVGVKIGKGACRVATLGAKCKPQAKKLPAPHPIPEPVAAPAPASPLDDHRFVAALAEKVVHYRAEQYRMWDSKPFQWTEIEMRTSNGIEMRFGMIADDDDPLFDFEDSNGIITSEFVWWK